jgi:signal transduction histidine kinase
MQARNAENEPVGLRSVLEDEVADLRKRYPDAEVSVPSAVPAVSVRANDMLASVFRNLLTNAIQHNDKDVPEVTVTVTEREDRVIVGVAGNGPGISDTQKETVFGEGQKGLDSRGTGLGLHLVEQYGGDVRIEDNDPTGAIFVVDLRKAA